jgi:hypothetical protein
VDLHEADGGHFHLPAVLIFAENEVDQSRGPNFDVVVVPKGRRYGENAVRSGMAVERTGGVRLPAGGGGARVVGVAVEAEDLKICWQERRCWRRCERTGARSLFPGRVS